MRFADMFMNGNNECTSDQRRPRYWKTALGALKQAWAHWGSNGANEACLAGRYLYLPWVRSQENIVYESRLIELFCPHGDATSVSVNAPSLE